MKPVSLKINGEQVAAVIEPRTHLADFLREHCRLTGTHVSCEHGVCGACTVMVDGAPVRACITLVVACDGSDVRTIEGFDDDDLMERLRNAFTREHALQCGFCTPGMLITARDIVQRLGRIDETRLRVELSGNLCRCTGYAGIVNAVSAVMKDLPEGFARVAGATLERPALAPAVAATAPAKVPATAMPKSAPPLPAPPGPAPSPSTRGATVVTDSFSLSLPPEKTWALLQDIPLVASCLPGADLIDYQGGDHVRGRVAVKLGPINAAFEGEADLVREPAERTAVVRGGGRDRGSGSRATGALTYTVSPEPGGGSRVDVTIEFALTGALAQFGRSGLVKAFVERLIAAFAENLAGHVQGKPTAQGAKLDLGRTVWGIIATWIRALVRRVFRRQ